MDNRVESNKALKAHPVESNSNGGLVVRNQSGFSTIYRLIDLSLVTILYYSAAAYYGTQIDTTSLILLFVNEARAQRESNRQKPKTHSHNVPDG